MSPPELFQMAWPSLAKYLEEFESPGPLYHPEGFPAGDHVAGRNRDRWPRPQRLHEQYQDCSDLWKGLRKLFCGSVTTGAMGGGFNKSSIPDSR